MDESKLTELMMQVREHLSSIDAKLETMEGRLSKLEDCIRDKNTYKTDDDFKTEMVKFLSKGLLAAIGIIATLSGAGACLKNIFG